MSKHPIRPPYPPGLADSNPAILVAHAANTAAGDSAARAYVPQRAPTTQTLLVIREGSGGHDRRPERSHHNIPANTA